MGPGVGVFGIYTLPAQQKTSVRVAGDGSFATRLVSYGLLQHTAPEPQQTHVPGVSRFPCLFFGEEVRKICLNLCP